MKRSPVQRWLLAVMLCGPVAAAHAATVVSLAGTGQVCGLAANVCTSGLALTGTVTLDHIGTPSTVDATSAQGDGWISAIFDLQWTGAISGSFHSSHVANETSFSDTAFTWNNLADNQIPPHHFDAISASFNSQFSDTGGVTQRLVANQAQFFMATEDTTWLGDLGFAFDAGLAPAAGFSTRVLSFGSFDVSQSGTGPEVFTADSINANFELSAFVVRSVPEPGTLALVGLAALGAWLGRRFSLPRR